MGNLKVGDVINYSFYKNVTIVGEDIEHFALQDKMGNIQYIYKDLVIKYGKKANK